MDALVSAWSLQMTRTELEAIFEAHGVPCGRIYRAPD
nr:hypothetical protein [Aquidulcibacter sp.]